MHMQRFLRLPSETERATCIACIVSLSYSSIPSLACVYRPLSVCLVASSLLPTLDVE